MDLKRICKFRLLFELLKEYFALELVNDAREEEGLVYNYNIITLVLLDWPLNKHVMLKWFRQKID